VVHNPEAIKKESPQVRLVTPPQQDHVQLQKFLHNLVQQQKSNEQNIHVLRGQVEKNQSSLKQIILHMQLVSNRATQPSTTPQQLDLLQQTHTQLLTQQNQLVIKKKNLLLLLLLLNVEN
jgi:ATP-dependent Clp protease ATP-binding subunit ClpA